MADDKILNIIKNAIIFEHRGRSFYNQVAKETKSKDLADFFTQMAEEEGKHIRLLERYYKAVLEGSGMSGLILEGEPEDLGPKIITEELKKEISGASYEAAAISAAINFEDNAVKLYQKGADEAKTEIEKELYHKLVNWEETHKRFLAELEEELMQEIWADNHFWPSI